MSKYYIKMKKGLKTFQVTDMNAYTKVAKRENNVFGK